MSIEARFSAELGEFSLNVDVHLPSRGVSALFGHSGSGKTTLLRAIAGLERFDGRLVVNGETWQDGKSFLPTHRRALGYVFQEASLFPHLDVDKNLRFGMSRVAESERRVAFDEAVAMMGIEHFLSRKPRRLSGGERQRVAIARALLTSPRLLLMDEPLSALDGRSKQEILPYLERLHDELAIPVIYVSHSLKEVTRLADHVVWMEQGRAEASGPIDEVFADLELAGRHGDEAGALLEVEVEAHEDEYHLSRLRCAYGELRVCHLPHLNVGSRVRVRIPARDVSLSRHDDAESSILNVWPVRIEALEAGEGGECLVRMRPPGEGAPLLARISRLSAERMALAPGQQLFARVKGAGLLD